MPERTGFPKTVVEVIHGGSYSPPGTLGQQNAPQVGIRTVDPVHLPGDPVFKHRSSQRPSLVTAVARRSWLIFSIFPNSKAMAAVSCALLGSS